MNRRNYVREQDRLVSSFGDRRPTLLLHACCAPCTSGVLEKLLVHFDVTLLWYNPNLYPEDEYIRRRDTLHELLKKMSLEQSVPVIEVPWNGKEYDLAVKGLEQEKEGGRRCEACFRLRLEKCAEIARQRQFDYFCTTLTVSRHKDAVRINAIGEETAKRTGAVWLPSDFKKRDGELRSQKIAEQYQLYRQVYCGCRYSRIAREEESHAVHIT